MKLIKITTKKFDINNPPDGTWVKYADGAEIQIRKWNAEVIREIRKPFVTSSMEYDTRANTLVPKETVDPDKFNDALNDYLVQNFKGFGDEDGEAIPVNTEGRRNMMKDISIGEFVMNYAKRIEMIDALQKEDDIKK